MSETHEIPYERRGEPSRRDSDFEPQQPWWVKPILQGVAPTVGLGFMIWWLTQTMLPLVSAINSKTDQMLTMQAQMRVEQGEIRNQNEKLIYIGRVSCANAAKDSDARERCLR